jgi:hypothetical protein
MDRENRRNGMEGVQQRLAAAMAREAVRKEGVEEMEKEGMAWKNG